MGKLGRKLQGWCADGHLYASNMRGRAVCELLFIPISDLPGIYVVYSYDQFR